MKIVTKAEGLNGQPNERPKRPVANLARDARN
jgi:hypothetical protein